MVVCRAFTTNPSSFPLSNDIFAAWLGALPDLDSDFDSDLLGLDIAGITS